MRRPPRGDAHGALHRASRRRSGARRRPQETAIPNAQPTFFDNITIADGPALVRAYIEELLPDVLEGRTEPGRVFGRLTNTEGVPDGYRAMNERRSHQGDAAVVRAL